jgi:hypothetical protein
MPYAPTKMEATGIQHKYNIRFIGTNRRQFTNNYSHANILPREIIDSRTRLLHCTESQTFFLCLILTL